jgi:glycosyltransferase involved in cell wall biosynthesis
LEEIPKRHRASVLPALWRRCPMRIRAAILDLAGIAFAPRPTAAATPRAGGITVAGLLSAATGLGEGARLAHAALRRLGIAAGVCDLSRHFGQADLTFEPPPCSPDDDGGTLIVHLNAPHLPLALAIIGRRRVRGRRIVGYWAWELDILPSSWERGLGYVHEVWVPSEFVAGAVRRRTKLPVRVVPHPVAAPPASGLGREGFGVPERAFVALAVLDMGSGYERKHPAGAVRAFRQAFGDDPDAMLLLKVVGGGRAPWAVREIETACAGAANIRLLQATLSREDQGALLRTADVVLSLHRSEGFGLVLAEAMRLGVPSVATGWSGNMQFMTESTAALVAHRLVPVRDRQGIYREKGALWAEPDVAHAADWLQRLRAEPELRRRIGEAARASAEQSFGDAAYRAAIGNALAPDHAPRGD